MGDVRGCAILLAMVGNDHYNVSGTCCCAGSAHYPMDQGFPLERFYRFVAPQAAADAAGEDDYRYVGMLYHVNAV